ncbi:MAG TPA: LysR family transcriptional regulator [Candidatus Dormibacteraeota bacterium]|nr:LysR family transcriptional regulator [Candidatus Dormibacteraeota bacterium]
MTLKHIREADLNLLLALDVLLAERSVTTAADRLGLTQSAVSRILGRLRATFGDPLFVRTSRGLTPTQRALELAGPVRDAVAGLERLLLEKPHFRPEEARRRFRVAAVDYAQVTLLARLWKRLASEAPFVDLEVRQPSAESERDLESGALDLLLMPRQASGAGIVWTPIARDEYVCVVWNRHPCRRLVLPRFAAMDHVLVAPREREGGVVDEVLTEKGLSRRVALQVATFLIVPYALVGSERIATVPRRMAEEFVRLHPLRILKPPLPIPGVVLCQGWHEIHRNDPGHRWLRQAVAAEAGSVRVA